MVSVFDPQTVPGFLSPEEGAALERAVRQASPYGPIVEVGVYCGRSTAYLGRAARQAGTVVFAVDHHRGSEEHQLGEAYHDPELWDGDAERLDTLPKLRDTLRRADLEDVVVPIVGASETVARYWRTPLRLLFIDGGHSLRAAFTDWRLWAMHVGPGGLLLVHDVIPRPDEGGRPPHEVFLRASASGLFDPVWRVGTLTALRRVG